MVVWIEMMFLIGGKVIEKIVCCFMKQCFSCCFNDVWQVVFYICDFVVDWVEVCNG